MNSERRTSTYHSPLRQEQKARTRQRILEAVGRLAEASASFEELSIRGVAREARVRERTVYRHFASREKLIDAFFAHHAANLGVAFPRSEADLLAHGERLFPGIEGADAIHRALMHSTAGQKVFRHLAPRYRASFQAAVADACRGLSSREQRWIAAAANTLASAAAWQVLHDRWGFSGKQAGRASRYAIELLLEGARARAAGRAPDSPRARRSSQPEEGTR